MGTERVGGSFRFSTPRNGEGQLYSKLLQNFRLLGVSSRTWVTMGCELLRGERHTSQQTAGSCKCLNPQFKVQVTKVSLALCRQM